MKKPLIIVCLLILCSFATEASEREVQIRIERISEMYLDRPYAGDPLGEATGYDSDPLYRFDAFDCVTYVETVLALAISMNQTEFQNLINQIRYKNGSVAYLLRNHFTSIDWNTNNYENGLLKDVTKTLFKNKTLVSTTLINKSAWFQKIHQIKVESPLVLSKLNYLPLSSILKNPEILSKISSGSVINIVRPNWQLSDKIGTNLDISHQGFAILKNDGQLYFRHASIKEEKVTEEPLLSYLQKMKDVKTIGGINILQIQSN